MTPIQASDETVMAATPAKVWRVLADIAAVPQWWPASLRVRVLRQLPGIVGSELELRPYGGRPFCCRVVAVEEPRRMQVEYFGGFITGTGEWQLEPTGSGTRVRYNIDVQAEGRLVAWLNRLVDLGKIHSRQMQNILRCLKRKCC